MPVSIWVDESQFPEAVARDLADCFRTRRVNHKFLYASYRQAEKWLKLHEAYSPARNDPACLTTYHQAFVAVAKMIEAKASLVGLGCGGGQKDAQLAGLLNATYTPVDVSLPLVVTASERVKNASQGIVCDLTTTTNLGNLLPKSRARLLTFFGMIPNFEPGLILPRLASLLREADLLLLSANLIPEDGIEEVLPQYANPLTEDWLRAFLEDFGIRDGNIEWRVEDNHGICADYFFSSKATIEGCELMPGDKLRLFFSYRYTPVHLREVLRQYGLEVRQEWITSSREEGIFLCHKRA